MDALVAADERRRAAGTRSTALRAEQKDVGRLIAKASGDEKDELLARGRELAAEVKAAEAERDEAAAEADAALLRPVERRRAGRPGRRRGRLPGRSSTSARRATSRPRASSPRDHVELGQLLGAIDVERGAKVSGSRFYYLTGVGALLELALVHLGDGAGHRRRASPR